MSSSAWIVVLADLKPSSSLGRERVDRAPVHAACRSLQICIDDGLTPRQTASSHSAYLMGIWPLKRLSFTSMVVPWNSFSNHLRKSVHPRQIRAIFNRNLAHRHIGSLSFGVVRDNTNFIMVVIKNSTTNPTTVQRAGAPSRATAKLPYGLIIWAPRASAKTS